MDGPGTADVLGTGVGHGVAIVMIGPDNGLCARIQKQTKPVLHAFRGRPIGVCVEGVELCVRR